MDIYEKDGTWNLAIPIGGHSQMRMEFKTEKEAQHYMKELKAGKSPGQIMADKVRKVLKPSLLSRLAFWRRNETSP